MSTIYVLTFMAMTQPLGDNQPLKYVDDFISNVQTFNTLSACENVGKILSDQYKTFEYNSKENQFYIKNLKLNDFIREDVAGYEPKTTYKCSQIND